jgi:molybdopterin converting factor subunit 1
VRVQVLLFASAREAAGCASETLELPEGATVADAREALSRKHPRLRPAWPSVRFAVGERFAAPEQRLETGDVLALVPPVSGG